MCTTPDYLSIMYVENDWTVPYFPGLPNPSKWGFCGVEDFKAVEWKLERKDTSRTAKVGTLPLKFFLIYYIVYALGNTRAMWKVGAYQWRK